jgi:hypothetical protein
MLAIYAGHDIVHAPHEVVLLTELTILFFGAITFGIMWTQVKTIWQYEEFFTICAWCRKIGHKGKWITIEEWVDQELDLKSSHGICPECCNEELENLKLW